MASVHNDLRETQRKKSVWRMRLRRLLSRVETWFSQDPGFSSEFALGHAYTQTLLTEGKRLKAGVAKAIQLIGYWQTKDIGLSQHQHALSPLFDQVPAVNPLDIQNVVEEDLGRSIQVLFRNWEKKPFASASLGEVHAAVGQQGQAYAVKVQYPDMAHALAADLQDIELFERLVGVTGWTLPIDAAAVLREILLQELDYTVEAKFLGQFQKAFSLDGDLIFPVVEGDLSGKRVLTATRLDGVPLLSFLEGASQEKRNHLASLLFLYGFGGPVMHGLLNADPNPGNFLVLENGEKLGLVDFGCCQNLSADQVRFDRVLWQALLLEDPELFRYTLHRMGIVLRLTEFDTSAYRAWEECMARPFRVPLFRWTSGYAQSWLDTTTQLLQEHAFAWPAAFFLLWRQRIGLVSILGLCGGEMNVREQMLNLLRRVHSVPAGMQ